MPQRNTNTSWHGGGAPFHELQPPPAPPALTANEGDVTLGQPHTPAPANGADTDDDEINRQLDDWRATHPHYGCSAQRASRGCMFIVVVALVVLTYIPYVILNHERSGAQVACIMIFHIPFALMLVSYFQILLIDPGTVPMFWHRYIEQRKPDAFKKCNKSKLYKPPRSHFDSVSQRLVLNMDHFCPWVANTVGFYNRKFFILFVTYCGITCVWVAITLPVMFSKQLFPLFGNSDSEYRPYIAPTPAPSPDDLDIPNGHRVLFGIAFIINILFGFLLVFFSYFHIKMALANETTIEHDGSKFDVGRRQNWQQVFGEQPRYWFLPIWGDGPSTDGIRWPTKHGGSDDHC